MTPDQQRKADASAVWKRHGERAPHVVGERIRNLAMANDIPEVKRWQGIAAALNTMMRGAGQ